MRAGLALAAVAVVALVAGCGPRTGTRAAGSALTVTATTTQAADLVRSVGGRRVDVEPILRPNTDPHEYELRPSDLEAIRASRLVVASGGEVDAWLGDAVQSAGGDARVLTLIDHVDAVPGDPHWWQDPRNGERALAAIRHALVAADPAGRAGYRRRAAAAIRRLRRLDAVIARCWAAVPPAARTLVTSHDALGYYARRYGLRVVGAVFPSRSTAGSPSAADVARLVDAIRRFHLRAVFAESAVDPRVERAIAAETGAAVGRPLWTDSLGPPGSSGATYAGSLAANTRALVAGLSGGATRCRLPRQPSAERAMRSPRAGSPDRPRANTQVRSAT